MELESLKYLFAASILVAGALGIWIPGMFANRKPTWLSPINAFGGGVLLAAGLVHMIPEAVEEFPKSNWPNEEYPWAYVAAGLAFLVLYFIENIVTASSVDMREEQERLAIASLRKLWSNRKAATPDQDIELHSVTCGAAPAEQTCNPSASDSDNWSSRLGHSRATDAAVVIQVFNSHDSEADGSGSRNSGAPFMEDSQRFTLTGGEDDHEGSWHPFGAICLALALSMHSVLAGLSLGVETSIDDTWATFIAIIVHKVAAAMALRSASLGAKCYTKKLRWQLIAVVAIFVLATPLGICIGIGVHTSDEGVASVFRAIGGGTFLYIACMDILHRELDPHSHSRNTLLWHFLATFVGFAIMCVVAVWT